MDPPSLLILRSIHAHTTHPGLPHQGGGKDACIWPDACHGGQLHAYFMVGGCMHMSWWAAACIRHGGPLHAYVSCMHVICHGGWVGPWVHAYAMVGTACIWHGGRLHAWHGGLLRAYVMVGGCMHVMVGHGRLHAYVMVGGCMWALHAYVMVGGCMHMPWWALHAYVVVMGRVHPRRYADMGHTSQSFY